MSKYILIILLTISAYIVCDDKKPKDSDKETKEVKEIVVSHNAEDIAKIIRLNEKEMDVYLATLIDLNRSDASRNEIVNLLRRSDCTKLEQKLIELLDNKDEKERFRSYIIQHLGVSLKNLQDNKIKDDIQKILRKYMEGEVDSLKGEAYLALLEVKDEFALKFLKDTIKQGPDITFLKLSIRYAFLLGLTDQIIEVRKYLKHENKVIQMTAIHYLGQWKDKTSEEKIKELLNSPDSQIKESAALAIELINKK